jgi:holo-[acyl-carrier protein] synthase
MNKIGIGVDIEKIDRFAKLTRDLDVSFLNRMFTEKEQNYCFSYKTAGPHLAARYAGKEAVIKALTELNRAKDVFYKDIEILNNERKVPVASILKESCDDLKINISFSHTEDMAIAFCVISGDQ